ncbi:MAG: hypothetical protein ACKVOU_14585 [Cytophagales bacterium]
MLNIVCECYLDTKVAEIVGEATKFGFNHQHSCGDVAKELKTILKNKIALGIVDEDRDKGSIPQYFLEFATIKVKEGLILKNIKKKPIT